MSESHDSTPPPAKQTGSAKNELATQLAALKLAEESVASDDVEEKSVDKVSDDEFFSDKEAEQEEHRSRSMKTLTPSSRPRLLSSQRMQAVFP